VYVWVSRASALANLNGQVLLHASYTPLDRLLHASCTPLTRLHTTVYVFSRASALAYLNGQEQALKSRGTVANSKVLLTRFLHASWMPLYTFLTHLFARLLRASRARANSAVGTAVGDAKKNSDASRMPPPVTRSSGIHMYTYNWENKYIVYIYMCIEYMCPHTTMYLASSFYYICVPNSIYTCIYIIGKTYL
jgi:hypothetical protein